MKIKLTEEQYNRLLTEDKKGRFNTITPQVLRLMKLIYDNHKLSDKEEIIDFLEKDMGLNRNESLTIYNTWLLDFRDTPINGWGESLGHELQFMGIYELRTYIPSYLCGRTHLPGFVTVEASSEENALNKIQNGDFIDMEIDENSREYQDPDLDYELEDVDLMEDMVIDMIRDYSIEELYNNDSFIHPKLQLKNV